MNRYEHGKIYIITDNDYTKTYYGSTTEPLSKRMERHRSDYRKYLNNERHFMSSFTLFDEFGMENCKIELVEEGKYNTKEELLRREGYFIKNNTCVNRNVAGRKMKEYTIDNKETILAKDREYKAKNKERAKEYMKEYREKNKERIQQQRKNYRENNKEKIQEYKRNNKEHILQKQRERRQKKQQEQEMEKI